MKILVTIMSILTFIAVIIMIYEILKEYKQNLEREFEKLQQENKQLKEELQEANDNIIWWSNRFKSVQRDNRQLKEKLEDKIELYEGDTISYQLGYDSAKALYEKILTELEEYLTKIAKNGADIEKLTCSNILVYLKELKEKYK